LAVFALALGWSSERGTPSETRWIVTAWCASALALLSKGLIGIVLPAVAVAAYSALSTDYSVWKRLRPLWGGALFTGAALPWFAAVSYANPDFFHFFFIREHV